MSMAKKRIDRQANKRATNMARRFFNSGMSFDQFLMKEGYIQKRK